VVVISLDGFRHDYAVRRATPHIDRLVREGAHVARLIPPWPSQTFPGHATLATGASPVRHGILNNRFHDRERGVFAYEDACAWYDAAPLWAHAQRHGLRAHVYHWVGSAGPCGADRVEAAEWRPFDKRIGDDAKVATLLDWLNRPAETRPRLLMSYFRGCDHDGHASGPGSRAVDACIEAVDARIGRLIAGLRGHPDVALFVVSDHGMTRTVGEVDVVQALADAAVAARVVASGPIAHVYLDEPDDPESLERARAAAARIEHARVHAPAQRHPTRTGDLILVADFGWWFRRDGGDPVPGHHGHDPEHPDMGAILWAWGAGVRPGASVQTARAADLAPTVTRLLNIPPPPDAEGAVLEALLAR
jgi:predicted AlkP superfamily pyrophosphatase or phosphodiesterase